MLKNNKTEGNVQHCNNNMFVIVYHENSVVRNLTDKAVFCK